MSEISVCYVFVFMSKVLIKEKTNRVCVVTLTAASHDLVL